MWCFFLFKDRFVAKFGNVLQTIHMLFLFSRGRQYNDKLYCASFPSKLTDALTLWDSLQGERDLSRWRCPAGLKMAGPWSSFRGWITSVQRKGFHRKILPWRLLSSLKFRRWLITVNNRYIKKNSKVAICENAPLSVVLVGVELGGKDEGDVHQKGSCWRSSRLCGRPWRKRSMYLGEQRSNWL